ncbi:hypothetical protein I7I53_01955 [Histoplasma capsulatum var. duboisii H88]|uniref:Zinc knuckle domain-containing protein n=1 Tax=Ajellomyces capsulatus (strain H88) TaxID=544711 RepID=A0A8A1LLT3_AJEC8|nr:hypothetical protein I7I53_01955 [Histoplasma capsulatum var. duboisii H88]
MNRYRNIPGLRTTSKATATTLCQKCLKRGHYSYECKASAQERPYTSRPSRTQQLANPKLVPELMSDVPNDLLRTKGVADEQLALKERERGRNREGSDYDRDHDDATHRRPEKRVRSVSPAYSADSVSTISTDRSWSRSPPRKRDIPSSARSRECKRMISRSVSPDSHLSSSSAGGKATTSRGKEGNTRRGKRSQSPVERGRYGSDRRGSWRNRSRSLSMDRSSIAKHRRSLTPRALDRNSRYPDRGRARHPRSSERARSMSRSPSRARGHEPPYDRGRGVPENPPPRKERSLSPFSKRLALTQAMNMINR